MQKEFKMLELIQILQYVPYRFVPCMCAGLAYYLAQKYAPQRGQEMRLLYEDELKRALDQDGSSSSSFITPKTLLSKRIMGNLSRGKYAYMISDRSGQRFPYQEMVQEWNGSWVHTSEYEAKQPQLEPKPTVKLIHKVYNMHILIE
jgi:hypothetical protein